ncbi:hypothetical protein SAMN03159437_02627 [Pseudomonas sp. NFACC25]|uniref:hypothetical protein n=1 Tax=Pseudomonas sp. NFACC25 TaxID=1566188 RepID=UPI000876BD9A|nr:hypothetical protein [Pseudomonas sp. NFACC25]SCX25051.1 hypothetical protein SAMN03159437_02627 [Pseudomonas sp. NFACC25]
MKKLVLALSIVMLAACGESKVTKVDGSSLLTADQTLKAMGKDLSQGESINYLVDIRMLHARYNNAEFGKKLDGMDMEEVRKEMASTKAYFIDLNRKRFIKVEQDEIDRLTAKVENMSQLRQTMEKDFDPETSVFTAPDLARIKERQRRQEEYRTQTDDEL